MLKKGNVNRKIADNQDRIATYGMNACHKRNVTERILNKFINLAFPPDL
jgi:hypothetical protein